MDHRPIRIAINGFGRIGRTILRLLHSARSGDGFEVVALNDIAPLASCAYLFKYDSVFGPFPGTVTHDDRSLSVNGTRIPFHAVPDVGAIDLTGVDLLLECTGAAGNRATAMRGLEAGARAVLISGPSAAADVTVVLGANEADLGDHRIVSNASCTTNALAPLLRVLDEAFGVISGHMTTGTVTPGRSPPSTSRATIPRGRGRRRCPWCPPPPRPGG